MIGTKEILGAATALLLGACLGGTSLGFDTDGVSGCAVGAAGCVCTQGGGCDPGLECLDGTCISPTCGDGLVQAAEECDDANGQNTDACTNACVLNVCGDGIINLAIEECDLGVANSNAGPCKTDCTDQVCGDGYVGPGEECDHGAANGLDGLCSAACTDLGGGTTGGVGTATTGSSSGAGSDTGTSGGDTSTGGTTGGGGTGGGSTGGGPVQVILDVIQDATVDSKNPDANLGTGATLNLDDKDGHRVLVQFDQAAIDAAAAGKTLVAATLTLPVADAGGLVASEPLDLHRNVVAWTENANWVCSDDIDPSANKTQCTGSAWTGGSYVVVPSASVMTMAGDTAVSFDVTADVADHLAGLTQNDGWLLKTPTEPAGSILNFHARESMLPAATLTLDLQ